jgi:CO/xanthine dehydrogenase FAD-binding subunit
VSLKGISPARPSLTEDGSLRIDALAPLADLVRSDEVRAFAPLISTSALSVASVQIRNAATLGGNLCLECRCLYYNQSHSFQFVAPCFKRGGDFCYFAPKSNRCWAIFAADTVPALLCLNAVICVTGPSGNQRRLHIDELYTGDALHPLSLSPTEIITEVIVPPAVGMSRQAFRKFSRRKGLEFAGLSVAVAAQVDENNTCLGVRIAVGSVSGGPLRAQSAEADLVGKDLSNRDVVRLTAAAVAKEIRPIAHHGYQAAHLRKCLEVETRRALAEAIGLEQVI